MEKIVFLCVFSLRIIQITSSDVSDHDVTLLRFQLNQSIQLNCSTDKFRTDWYHQNPETRRLTLLVSLIYKALLYTSYHRHRLTAEQTGSNTFSLFISELTESDSGLYFCGTSADHEMHFGKPIKLVMEDREDKVHYVTEPPEDIEITASTVKVMLTEREMIFGGAGLAVLVFFLATVVAGGIIHSYGWRKGWAAAKRAGLTD